MVDEFLVDDRLNRDVGRGRRQRIAAVTRRAAARIGPWLGERDRFANHDAADGESAAEAFAHEQHVRHDVVVLDREHFPGPPEAGDHLVADEQRTDLGRERPQLVQVAGRRDDVARGALHRLDDDRGDVVRRLERDLRAQKVDAVPVAFGERLPERTALARRVRARVHARGQGAEAVLEAARQQRQHPARLAVEPAPESHDFMAPRGSPGQAQRGFDRFGAARVELRPVQVAGREPRDQFDQRGTMLRREAPHVHALELLRHFGDIARMGVAEARDTDAGKQIDVAIAVHVPQHGALAAVHTQFAEERDALGPGRQVLGLSVEDTL